MTSRKSPEGATVEVDVGGAVVTDVVGFGATEVVVADVVTDEVVVALDVVGLETLVVMVVVGASVVV
jgi:hypothetical protein